MFQARIRTKFILILALAAVAPIAIGVISIRLLGVRHYEHGQGQLYQTMAEHLAAELGLVIRHEAHGFREWSMGEAIAAAVADARPPETTPEERLRGIAAWEAAWPELTPHDSRLRPLLDNAVVDRLERFRRFHPLFVEMLVTDEHGRLLAATNKTSDYWQGDEDWWRAAMALETGAVGAEGIHFDDSAGVYSLDLAAPIRPPADPAAAPLGVVKAVLTASPLLGSLRPSLTSNQPRTLVVLEDGRILARLFARDVVPLQEALPPNVSEALFTGRTGWRLLRMGSAADQHLLAYAALQLADDPSHHTRLSGVSPMYVVVHRDRAVVNAPMTMQALLLYVAGATLVLLFIWAGMFIAEKKIVGPLAVLQSAAQAISSSAGLTRRTDGLPPRPSAARRAEAEAMTERVQSIQTGDELEDLARDFGLMADRVLRYHEELETEIALRMEDMEHDQRVARDFQQALLPHSYPEVPEQGQAGVLRLRFDHVYEPTLAVGGDFFHVARISPHRARVFIADVMGHGARSALVSAILRTLLEDVAPEAGDPADLLRRINARFCASLPSQEDCIFATACTLVIDAYHGTLEYASAGHPPPVHLRGRAQRAEYLPFPPGARAAMGLFEAADYRCLTRSFHPGDSLLLYTDGLQEALNAAGEEFGAERLLNALHALVGRPAPELTRSVMAALRAFSAPDADQDDVCLIAIDARPLISEPPVGLPGGAPAAPGRRGPSPGSSRSTLPY